MRWINKTITVFDLIGGNVESLIQGKKTLSSDPDCPVDLKEFDYSNYADLTLLFNNTIVVPMYFSHSTENIGWFQGNCEDWLSSSTTDIWVTGESQSMLQEVTNYSGNIVVGFNYANPPLFSGVLEDGENVAYVIGGGFDEGYVEGTGIIYVTEKSTGATTFMYNLSAFHGSADCSWFVRQPGYCAPPVTQGDPFIDRGPIVSPNELFYQLSGIKSVDDFDDSIYIIHKTY